MITNETKRLLLILFLVIVIRLIGLMTVFTIEGDSPVYIEMANNIYHGNWKAALAREYHPLYSILMAGAYFIVHDWVAAGQVISLISGILLLFPIYYLTRDVFGGTIAAITAVLFAFHPAGNTFSPIVLSQSLYFLFFVTSLWIAWKAIHYQSGKFFLATGVLSGFAYLVRPEGLGIALLLGFQTIITLVLSFHRRIWKPHFKRLCLLCLGTLITISPYLVYIKAETGQWQLSKKKSILTALTNNSSSLSLPLQELLPTAMIPCYSKLTGDYFTTFLFQIILFILIYNPVLFLLMLFGLFYRKTIHREHIYETFSMLVVLFFLAVFSLFYLSERQPPPLVLMSLFWTAIGFYELNILVQARIFRSTAAQNLTQNKFFWFSSLLLIVFLLPYTFHLKDKDKIAQKIAGEWMLANCKPNSFILTDMSRLAFYAKSYYVPFQNRPNISKYTDLINFIRKPDIEGYGYFRFGYNIPAESHIDYVAIDRSQIQRYCPDFINSVKPDILEQIFIKPHPQGEIVIYKVK